MTDVAVELLDRQPIRVVWNRLGFLAFDDEGYFDSGSFDHQQRARGELALASLDAESKEAAIVVDTAARFAAQGKH